MKTFNLFYSCMSFLVHFFVSCDIICINIHAFNMGDYDVKQINQTNKDQRNHNEQQD